MSNLPSLREQFFSNTGDVLNGGKLYFYAPTTTTTKAVYTTSARSVAHTNPITLDSAGRAPEIYATPSEQYRVVLKDSSLNTIWDIDNIYPAMLDLADLSSHFYETAENPKHYGADGDGVDDESADIQQAIDAAVSGGRDGVVDLLGRTYRADSAISLPSGITLRNGSIDFSNCDADAYLSAAGSVSATVALSGSNVAAGAQIFFTASTAGVSVGQLLLLADSSTGSTEIARVASFTANTSIVVDSPLTQAYLFASSTYRRITPVVDVIVENLKITANSSPTGLGVALHFKYCDGVTVRGLDVSGIGTAASACGVHVDSTANADIGGLMVFGASPPSDGSLSAALKIERSLGVRSSGLYAESCDVGVSILGQSTQVHIHGANTRNCYHGAHCGESNATFASCWFVGGSTVTLGDQIAMYNGGASWRYSFVDVVSDSRGAAAVGDNSGDLQAGDAVFVGCRLSSGGSYVVSAAVLSGGSVAFRDCEITGSADGVRLVAQADGSVFSVENCRIRCTAQAILFDSSVAGVDYTGKVSDVDTDGAISLLDTGGSGGSRSQITNNNIRRASTFTGETRAINIAAAIRAQISGNSLEAENGDWLDYGIHVTGSSGLGNDWLLIQNNTVEIHDTVGIYTSFSGHISMTGNVVSGAAGATNAVSVNTACLSCVVAGNSLTGGSGGAVLAFAGSSPNAIVAAVVVGNSLQNGTHALSRSNTAADFIFEGNGMIGQTTMMSASSVSTGVLSTLVAITATEIVGTSAGDLGHASGVTLVAAPGAGKIIDPILVAIDYTFATAAYTAGGNVTAKYDGGADCTGAASAANSFGSASSVQHILRPVTGLALANAALVLVAAAGFTQPGAAAGSANIRTFYRLIDA